MNRFFFFFLLPLFCLTSVVLGGGSVVPVGSYLYANPKNAETYKGRLTITFKTPGERMVIAWGRKWRKDRKKRKGTVEKDREKFKPYLAKSINGGKGAIFWNLPIDRYDIVIIDDEKMTVFEGIALHREAKEDPNFSGYLDEVRESLGPNKEKIGGWEGFFDHKEFLRLETDGDRAGVFLQQMRLGVALAESGAVLKGCIHSIDVVWVQRAKVEGAGWQVISRQQLYRDEIKSRKFFRHAFVPELNGVRIGTRPKEIGPVELPELPAAKKK